MLFFEKKTTITIIFYKKECYYYVKKRIKHSNLNFDIIKKNQLLSKDMREEYNIMDLTDRAPAILDKLNRGEKTPDSFLVLAKKVGIDLII